MSYTRISDRLTASLQIAPKDISALAKDGFTDIVNNRPDGESPDQPNARKVEAEAGRQGLEY